MKRNRKERSMAVVSAVLVLVAAGCAGGRTASSDNTPALEGALPAVAETRSNESAQPAGESASVLAPGPYVYHYYPDAQVYYAPDRGLFFWRGAAHWGFGHALPSWHHLDSASRVLSLDTDRPYRVHEQVTAIFDD